MKKIVVIWILILGWSVSFSQTGQPCAKVDQDRSISGMTELLMKDGVFYQNLRASYAEAVNHNVGKNIITSSKYGMEYILKNTILLDEDFVVASDYLNGVKRGNQIDFTTLTGQPSDKWAAIRFEGVDYIYAKVSCMNPQKSKKPGVYQEKEPEPELKSVTETTGNHDVPDHGQKKLMSEADNTANSKEVKVVVLGDETWWGGLTRTQRRLVRVGSALVVAGATGFLLHDKNHQWYFWFPKSSPHGEMSGGRKFGDTANQNGNGEETGGRGN